MRIQRATSIIGIFFFSTFWSVTGSGEDSIDTEELMESLEIAQANEISFRTSNRIITGKLGLVSSDGVELNQLIDGGEVSYFFNWSQIQDVAFPDEAFLGVAFGLAEEGEIAVALNLLNQMFNLRRAFFDVMRLESREPFLKLVDWTLQLENYPRVIGLIDLLEKYFPEDQFQRFFSDARLQAFIGSELFEDAEALARAWIEKRLLYGDSALGWVALAEILLYKQNPDHALLVALQPIVFSSHLPKDFLDQAYAFAIYAAGQLGDRQQARMLLDEMEERGISWPAQARGIPSENSILSIFEDTTDSLDSWLASEDNDYQDAEESGIELNEMLTEEEESSPAVIQRPLPGEWLPRTRLPTNN